MSFSVKTKNYNSFLFHLINHSRFHTHNFLSEFEKPNISFDEEDFYKITYKNFELISTENSLNLKYKTDFINICFLNVSKNFKNHKFININHTFNNISKFPEFFKNYITNSTEIDENYLLTLEEFYQQPEEFNSGEFEEVEKLLLKLIKDFNNSKIKMGVEIDENLIFFDRLFIIFSINNPLNENETITETFENTIYILLDETLEECPISKETAEKTAKIIKCSHKFSEKPLNEWLNIKKICPLCRTEL